MTKEPCGKFIDPNTNAEIVVFARDGESCDDAIARVMKHHGVQKQ